MEEIGKQAEQLDFGGGEEIAFYRQGCLGIARLTRPRALNALNKNMALALMRALEAWARDQAIAHVLVEGEGRAFCAGGDVINAYHHGKMGQPDYDLFTTEYRLNGVIGRFPKPYIAYLDGIVMGGGVGISLHGSHRIVTPNTVFAMPEAAIGFFPDVGTATILPNLPDYFGFYLGLTGARVKWGDCLKTGIATHAIGEEDYPLLRQKLSEGETPDQILARINRHVSGETSSETCQIIARCFAGDTVEAIMQALTNEQEAEFAAIALEMMQKQAPLSMKIALQQMQICQTKSLEACLVLDNRLAHHMIEAPDFYEGVRALLIDKDNNPRWNPEKLEDVTDDHVAGFFAPVLRELSW